MFPGLDHVHQIHGSCVLGIAGLLFVPKIVVGMGMYMSIAVKLVMKNLKSLPLPRYLAQGTLQPQLLSTGVHLPGFI